MSDTEAPVEVKRRGRPPKAGSEVAEEPKKGRGRPAAAKKPEKRESDVAESNGDAPPAKRGRGRPKKNKNKAPAVSSGKGRGRPAKKPAPKESESENEDPEDDVDDEEDASADES